MIKLIDILKESFTDKDYAYSWQKPDGTLIPINYNHGSDAHDFRKGEKDFDPKDDHTKLLWKRGWQRVTYGQQSVYSHNELMPPNPKQKASLIDLAKKIGMDKVEWDGGESVKDRILWSVHDQLQEKFT